MRILTLLKNNFFVFSAYVFAGSLTALSFSNHFLHLNYRLPVSQLLFMLLILLFSYLVYLVVYRFAGFKRLINYSIKYKWLWLCFSIAVGALFIPPILFKVPVNLIINASEQGMPPSQRNEVGVIEIKIEGSRVPLEWLTQNGKWEVKDWLGTTGIFSSGQQVSTLTYKYETNLDEIEVEILFAESESAGVAHVQIEQEFQNYDLQARDDGTRKVIITAATPQLSMRWKAFVLLSYVSDILLVGFLIFMVAVWGFTSPALVNKCRLLGQKLFRNEKATINNIINDETHPASSAESSTINKHGVVWRYLSALLFITPALLAALRMQTELSFATMLFNGGKECLQTNLCFVVLFFYAFLFMHALGTFFLPDPPFMKKPFLVAFDVDLIRFFGGASILSIFGFILGLLKLLTPWVTIPIFCGVLYIYFLQSPDIFNRFWNWLAARSIKSPKGVRNGFPLRYLVIFLNSVILILIFYILLVRGVLPDLISSDVMQLYFSYFAEVRLLHGTWIDHAHPIIYDFMIGRGMGVYLFFTSFTNQYFIQIVSVIYLVTIALIVYQFIFIIIPHDTDKPNWGGIRHILPACATITALSSLIFITETGKYHLQTNAFLTFLSLTSLRFLFLDMKQSKWLFRILLPAVIAMPIAFFQSEIFIIAILFVAAVTVYLRRGPQFAKYCVFLMIGSAIATFFSLLFNQMYIGIAELNPVSFFIRFANLEKLTQWTSIEMINYINWTQNISLFSLESAKDYFFEYIYPIVELKTLYIYTGSLFILLGDVLQSGIKFHIPRKLFLSKVLTLCCVFLSFSVIWKLFVILVPMGSVIRLFYFLNIYPSTACFAAVIYIILACQQTTIHKAEFREKTKKWVILSLLLGSGLLIYSMILGYPHLIRLQVILIIAAMIAILHRGWSLRIFINLQKFSTTTAFIIPFLVSCIALYGAAVSFRKNAGLPIVPSAIRYFTGSEGVIEGMPPTKMNFHRCLEILEAAARR